MLYPEKKSFVWRLMKIKNVENCLLQTNRNDKLTVFQCPILIQHYGLFQNYFIKINS